MRPEKGVPTDVRDGETAEKKRKLVEKIAEANTIKNGDGNIVIRNDDPWVCDDSWDALYEKLAAQKE